MILLFHVINSNLPTFRLLESGPLFLALRSMEHGVELFFGISGVVIFGVLSRKPKALPFFVDRATRIYAVLWPSVLVLALLGNLTHYEGRTVTQAGVLVANLLALVPLAPMRLIHPAAWSLSYELAFYGLCGLTLVGPARWRRLSAVIAVLAGAWLLTTHVRAVLMPVGLLIAYLVQVHRWNRFGLPAEIGFVVFLAAWELMSRSFQGDLMSVTAGDMTTGWRPLLLIIAVLAGSSLFLGLVSGQGLLCRLLRTPLLQWLGTISYSLYLWHPIVMSMMKHILVVSGSVTHLGPAAQSAFLLIGAPPSLLCAWISQQTLERRLTTAIRGLVEGKSRAVPPTATSGVVSEAAG